VVDNVGSIRVLEKIGMQLEWRLREKEYYKAGGGISFFSLFWSLSGVLSSKPTTLAKVHHRPDNHLDVRPTIFGGQPVPARR
jgi:hypothetical protein